MKPAEMYLADSPSIVKTVLGSCVSVTLFNRRLKVGAICHALLPHCKKMTECKGECTDGFKYVDCSIRCMLGKFRSLGISHRETEVKLFGGAHMFIARAGDRETVGAQNIVTALRILREERLNLCTSDTGGSQGRKIFFYTHTGEIFLKRLGTGERELAADVIQTESRLLTAALGKNMIRRNE
jgi:chemotaxis protein CheD